MTELAKEFRALWQSGGSMNDLLSRFVVETKSRASGCWVREEQQLRLIGFGCASEMPDEVSQGFQAATRCVRLDQTGLGIVQAAVTGKPAIGRRDATATGLVGSASWITMFGANTSLAVPIHEVESNTVTGVLAVSTAAFVKEDDALWRTMRDLATELGATKRIVD